MTKNKNCLICKKTEDHDDIFNLNEIYYKGKMEYIHRECERFNVQRCAHCSERCNMLEQYDKKCHECGHIRENQHCIDCNKGLIDSNYTKIDNNKVGDWCYRYHKTYKKVRVSEIKRYPIHHGCNYLKCKRCNDIVFSEEKTCIKCLKEINNFMEETLDVVIYDKDIDNADKIRETNNRYHWLYDEIKYDLKKALRNFKKIKYKVTYTPKKEYVKKVRDVNDFMEETLDVVIYDKDIDNADKIRETNNRYHWLYDEIKYDLKKTLRNFKKIKYKVTYTPKKEQPLIINVTEKDEHIIAKPFNIKAINEDKEVIYMNELIKYSNDLINKGYSRRYSDEGDIKTHPKGEYFKSRSYSLLGSLFRYKFIYHTNKHSNFCVKYYGGGKRKRRIEYDISTKDVEYYSRCREWKDKYIDHDEFNLDNISWRFRIHEGVKKHVLFKIKNRIRFLINKIKQLRKLKNIKHKVTNKPKKEQPLIINVTEKDESLIASKSTLNLVNRLRGGSLKKSKSNITMSKIFNNVINNSRTLLRKKKITKVFKKRIDTAISSYRRIRRIPKNRRFPQVQKTMNSLIRNLKKVGEVIKRFKESKPRKSQKPNNFKDFNTFTDKNEKINFRKRHRKDIIDVFNGLEDETIIKLNNDNERLTLAKLIDKNYQANDNINMVIIFNNIHYTLNERNINLIKKKIVRGIKKIKVDKGITESDTEIVTWIETAHEITLRGVDKEQVRVMMRNKTGKRVKEIDNGKFFKYTIKPKYYLKAWARYGLFDEVDSKNYNINCFIRSMKEHKTLTEPELNSLKLSVKNRCLAIKDIRKFADRVGLHIRLTVYRPNKDDPKRKNNNTYNIGDKKSERKFKIGCIDQHYFIDDNKTNVTKYALNNFNRVKNKEDWNRVRSITKDKKTNKNKYRTMPKSKNERYSTSSMVLINFLLDNKKRWLERIKYTKALQGTQFYDKTDVIKNLEYCESDVRLVNDVEEDYNEDSAIVDDIDNGLVNKNVDKVKNKDDIFLDNFIEKLRKEAEAKGNYIFSVSDFPKIYFDCETGKDSSRQHKAFLICAEYVKNGRVTKKSFRTAKEFLESIKEPSLLIAHNLGYDYRFLMDHLEKVDLIEKEKSVMAGTVHYRKNDGKLLKLYLKDSLKVIPMALAKFSKCFQIKDDVIKPEMPYELHKEHVKEGNKWAKLKEVRKELGDPFIYNRFLKKVREYGLIRKRNREHFNIFEFYNKCCYHQKEVMPYNLYKTNTVRLRRAKIELALNQFKTKKEKKQFRANIKRWGLIDKRDPKYFKHIEYAKRYCELDCTILRKGYETFKEWMQEATGLNVDEYVSLPSLIHKYLINEGCYDGVYELSGVVREFIQKCVVGGRCMTRDNKKWHVKTLIQDFDAVSLYPSAMARLGGFLKGIPKVIKNKRYEDIKDYDGYFVEVNIQKVGKKRHFPLLTRKNEDGIRQFENDITGSVYVDKIGLEDLIKFQEIKFTIVRGYYFDEGRNYKIKDTMAELFNERLKKKAEIMSDGSKGNPAQIVYKLLMNSAYGKTIMKPIETENIFKDSKLDKDAYCIRHHNSIKYSHPLLGSEDKFIIKKIKNIDEHYSIPQVGVEILSMSKRIMNEVMCLADDEGIIIYYQDTDSMHIEADKIKLLESKFKKLYGRDLVGKGMGQFHSDFDFAHDKGILPVAIESYFLAKKVYMDHVIAVDDGEEKEHYHVRMKGIPSKVVESYGDLKDMYEKLYQGNKHKFDLLKVKDSFQFNNDYTIVTKDDFKREVCYKLPKARTEGNII